MEDDTCRVSTFDRDDVSFYNVGGLTLAPVRWKFKESEIVSSRKGDSTTTLPTLFKMYEWYINYISTLLNPSLTNSLNEFLSVG